MSGSNNGTGQPHVFRCAECRRSRVSRSAGYSFRVVLSGRSRAVARSHGGGRMQRRKHEYRCLDCGHVGWSAHIDLTRSKVEPWGGQ